MLTPVDDHCAVKIRVENWYICLCHASFAPLNTGCNPPAPGNIIKFDPFIFIRNTFSQSWTSIQTDEHGSEIDCEKKIYSLSTNLQSYEGIDRGTFDIDQGYSRINPIIGRLNILQIVEVYVHGSWEHGNQKKNTRMTYSNQAQDTKSPVDALWSDHAAAGVQCTYTRRIPVPTANVINVLIASITLWQGLDLDEIDVCEVRTSWMKCVPSSR